MKTIRSINHEPGSYGLNKASLSCFGDKRYIYEDGVKSCAYGHYQTFRENFTSKINFTDQKDFSYCEDKI